MTGPDSPSVLLQRAAEKLEQAAANIPAPQFWDREIRGADLSKSGAVWAKLVGPPAAAPLVAWLRSQATLIRRQWYPGSPSYEPWPVMQFARLILGEPRKD